MAWIFFARVDSHPLKTTLALLSPIPAGSSWGGLHLGTNASAPFRFPAFYSL